MMMKNKMIRALGLSAVAVGLNIGIADAATIEGNAQVVVLSTINLTETAALDFGTIAAFGDGETTGTAYQTILTMPADGSGSSVAVETGGTLGTESNIVVIVEGNPGIFSVSGAAPNTPLTVVTVDTDVMDDPSGTSAFEFDLATSGTYMTTNGSGNTFTTDTDGTGAMVFQVGGTLTTKITGLTVDVQLQAFDDATYTGNYTVTVTY